MSVSANAFAIGEPGDAIIAGLVDMSLNNIAVVDLNGSSLSYTITSQSGAMYPTPEPSSLALFAIGGAATPALLCRRAVAQAG